ncbi:MAG: hypothetical protein WAV07_11240 [Candidatus Contendobacter sp.]
MFHMNPTAPTLRLTATVLLARQVNRLTLISLAGVRALDLRVESLPERSGHALVAEFAAGSEIPGHRRVLATYATETEALRQLDRLTRSPGRWIAWLAWGLIGAMFLFVIWFLFFLPVETDRLSGLAVGDAGDIDRLALPEERIRSARAGHDAWPPPARVDDPAEHSVLPRGGDAAGRVGR